MLNTAVYIKLLTKSFNKNTFLNPNTVAIYDSSSISKDKKHVVIYS